MSDDPYSDDSDSGDGGAITMPEAQITPGTPDYEFSPDTITPEGHDTPAQKDAQSMVHDVLGPITDPMNAENKANEGQPSPWDRDIPEGPPGMWDN